MLVSNGRPVRQTSAVDMVADRDEAMGANRVWRPALTSRSPA
jgi:hypothetical protein